jgi:uncharacterized membrane protein
MWTDTKVRGAQKEKSASSPLLIRPAGRLSSIGLNMAFALSLWLLSTSVLKYLAVTPDTYGIFWPRHGWLIAHICGGVAALLVGPIQLRIGWSRRQPKLHRVLGVVYVISVAVSAVSALQLAFRTDYGWVFGMGLVCMAVAWVITTVLATVAVCRKMMEQHREWIIRSYVVTFGFVIFRLLVSFLEIAGVGTLQEQLVAAAWFSWSMPLLVTETLLQARKVLGRERKDASLWEVRDFGSSSSPLVHSAISPWQFEKGTAAGIPEAGDTRQSLSEVPLSLWGQPDPAADAGDGPLSRRASNQP